MGNLCTGEKQIEQQKQGLEFEDENNHWSGQTAQPPQFFVGSNLRNLPEDLKKGEELAKLQELINLMKSNERKGKKQLAITRKHQQGDFLEDPYLITLVGQSTKAIYIGQWRYNKLLGSSVPSGIGRLYKEGEIMQGEIITVLSDNEGGSNKIKKDLVYEMIKENKMRAKFFKLQDKEDNQSYEIAEGTKELNVLLDGEGRIFSRTMERMGQFRMGKLHGKGEISIKYGKDIYLYKGEFYEGVKQGKGVEEFKNIKYDGQFLNDNKQGLGRLTLFISHKFHKEQEQQQEKIKLEYADRNASEIIDQIQQFIKRKSQFQQIIADQLKDELPWQGPSKKIKGIAFTQDAKFILEHMRRTKFKEQYVGQFQKNQFNGHGRYTWFSGKCYDGEWKDGKMHGMGQFFWQSGMQYYQGEYENDLKQGKGTIYWSISKRYRGQWALGLRHGYGELIDITDCSKPEEQTKKMRLKVIGGLFNKDKLEEKHKYFTFERQFSTKCTIYDLQKEYEKMALKIQGKPFEEVQFLARYKKDNQLSQ